MISIRLLYSLEYLSVRITYQKLELRKVLQHFLFFQLQSHHQIAIFLPVCKLYIHFHSKLTLNFQFLTQLILNYHLIEILQELYHFLKFVGNSRKMRIKVFIMNRIPFFKFKNDY